MLLSVALALLIAQSISAILLYRAQQERREMAILNAVAFRLVTRGGEEFRRPGGPRWDQGHEHEGAPSLRWLGMRPQILSASPLRPGETRDEKREALLGRILQEQGVTVAQLAVVTRRAGQDPYALEQLRERRRFRNDPELEQREIVLAALRQEPGGSWLAARMIVPPPQPRAFGSLLLQTLVLYAVLVGGLAVLLRRITRPLAALTGRVEHFARTREPDGQLEPQGPDDVRRLIEAHNAMEGRIAALLDEKDVMLGAIGHDLKTPLAALRVRIESVEDEAERARMAATIEDITRTLDDILSLARIGRASDPLEPTELSALVAAVVEEYEDMGEPVTLAGMERIVLPLRVTWLRRALRNLIGNALRYGGTARVSLQKQGGSAVVRVEDRGPGIPESQIARMMEPFTRGDPSRNRATGGAGLGLTLARAIAEQHGGTLTLSNRSEGGLAAELRLPLPG